MLGLTQLQKNLVLAVYSILYGEWAHKWSKRSIFALISRHLSVDMSADALGIINIGNSTLL